MASRIELGAGAIGPEPGTAPQGLLILVVAELALLFVLRRWMRSAHGG